MKIFLDANIIVSVLRKEYPLFTYSSRILSLADSKKFSIYTSPVCLAIAFYFAEKKFKSKLAKEKIAIMCKHINIAGTSSSAVLKSIANIAVVDFEDGLEYYSAVESKCDCIITEDVNDYYFADLEVVSSNDFFLKYMSKSK